MPRSHYLCQDFLSCYVVHTSWLGRDRQVTHYKTFGQEESRMSRSALQTTYYHKKQMNNELKSGIVN